MTSPPQFPIPRSSAGVAPLRRPGSIRRTTSIDTAWPDGPEQPRTMVGRARDILTPAAGPPVELASAQFRLAVSPRREIQSLETSPAHPRTAELVGVQAGNVRRSSRALIADVLGDIRGTPLYQLIDDYTGASLVAVWGYMRWDSQWRPAFAAPAMIDVCIGHAAGAGSLTPAGSTNSAIQSRAVVGPLENPADPEGWHAMDATSGPGARRVRRIDLWREGANIRVEGGFQDSAPQPDGTRVAVHEYRIEALVDEAGILVELSAEGLILPYAECPGSVLQIQRMVGRKVADLRESVSIELAGPLGCTHLNDVLRSLADVPALAAALPPLDPSLM